MFEIDKRHGDCCSCRLLAEAMHCDPGMVSFSYCRSVLHQHWIMHCNHGGLSAEEQQQSNDGWRGLGTMDPIKAILIKNI